MVKPKQAVIIIKRYQNRKLYDTQNSTYVTLEDIGIMIRRGDDVRVIDNKSKDDLTSVTLTQIIFEEEKKKKSILPLQTLKQIIREGGDAIKGFVNKTSDSMHETIYNAKENAETIYEKIEEALQPNDEGLIKDVFQKTQDFSKNLEGKIKGAVGSITHVSTLQAEVRKLRQKIIYLEKKLRTYEK